MKKEPYIFENRKKLMEGKGMAKDKIKDEHKEILYAGTGCLLICSGIALIILAICWSIAGFPGLK